MILPSYGGIMSSIIRISVPFSNESAYKEQTGGGVWFSDELSDWLRENTRGFTSRDEFPCPNTWSHERGVLSEWQYSGYHVFMFNDPATAMRFKLTWA